MPIRFEHTKVDVPMRASPIVPGWVREGTPVANSAELSRSADGTTFTVVWDCTAGVFEWFYGFDETIHILEGSVILQDGGNPPTRLGPGDVVFFPKGSQVVWTVEGYVKKIAFFRRVIPNPLNGPYKLLRLLRNRVRGRSLTPLGSIGQVI